MPLLRDAALRTRAYAYPRDGHPCGIDVHSDDADVSVNIASHLTKRTAIPKRRFEDLEQEAAGRLGHAGKANRDLDSINSRPG